MGSGGKVLTNAAGRPSKLSEWLNDLVSVRKRPLQRTGRQVICQLDAGTAEHEERRSRHRRTRSHTCAPRCSLIYHTRTVVLYFIMCFILHAA